MVISLVLPRITHIGAGVREQLPFILEQLKVKRPLNVTDRPLVEHHVLDDIFILLDNNEIQYAVFDSVCPDPTTAVVDALLAALDTGKHDCLVAVGGGSPMDTAKAAAILKSHPGKSLRDVKTPFVTGESKIPVVCLPTTAGAGSEMTRFAVITDTDVNEKVLIMGIGGVAVAALIHVELSMSMPPRITADTGVDALTHGLEAYLSQRQNEHADVLAVSGVRRILQNITVVLQDPQNVEARTQMMLGATHTGMAFSTSSVVLIHGMSRPLGALFHVPHGMANAMLLNAVLRWTGPHLQPTILRGNLGLTSSRKERISG